MALRLILWVNRARRGHWLFCQTTDIAWYTVRTQVVTHGIQNRQYRQRERDKLRLWNCKHVGALSSHLWVEGGRRKRRKRRGEVSSGKSHVLPFTIPPNIPDCMQIHWIVPLNQTEMSLCWCPPILEALFLLNTPPRHMIFILGIREKWSTEERTERPPLLLSLPVI